MFCSNCGKEIKESYKFCKYCGNKIEPINDTNEQVQEDNIDSNEQAEGEQQKSDKTSSDENNFSKNQTIEIEQSKEEQDSNKPINFKPKNDYSILISSAIILIILVIGFFFMSVFDYIQTNNDYLKAVNTDELVLTNKKPLEILDIINIAEENKDRYLNNFAKFQFQRDRYYLKYFKFINECNIAFSNKLYNIYGGDFNSAKIGIIRSDDAYITTLPQCPSLLFAQGCVAEIDINIERLLKKDSKYLSQCVIDYLKMEDKKQEASRVDGPDWEKYILSTEIKYYKNFLKKYPNFILKEEMKKDIEKDIDCLSKY